MIRKTRNFFLGILSFVPLVSLIITIILFGQWVSEGISIYNLHVHSFIPILIVQALNIVISSTVIVMMALHAAKYSNLDKNQLVIWVLLLSFFSIISLPVYWVIYVKDDIGDKKIIKEFENSDSIAVKDCENEEAKEDDENDTFIIDDIDNLEEEK